jgi:serine O-acetyltransferase
MCNFIRAIREDIQAAMSRDPAARSVWEIFLLYSGLHALWLHRIAHFFWIHNCYFFARAISQTTRYFTQIEIHPGARIGRRFFIDHGSGVVIGETAEIGDDVLMYQGVVLGGTSSDKKKRHPTIGNNVVIGSHAIILGAITVGDDARIGSGSVVVKAVPPGATVVGVPGHVVQEKRKLHIDLDHDKLPDPVAQAIQLVLKEQDELIQRIKKLEERANIPHHDEKSRLIREKMGSEFKDGGGI